jgi:hypothetical protein
MDQLSWLLMRTTAEVLDVELSDFRAERPDYLLCDAAAPWAGASPSCSACRW